MGNVALNHEKRRFGSYLVEGKALLQLSPHPNAIWLAD